LGGWIGLCCLSDGGEGPAVQQKKKLKNPINALDKRWIDGKKR